MSAEEATIKRVCPQCGRVLDETWKSCPYCGKSLTGAAKPPKMGRKWTIVSIIFGVVSLLIFGMPLGAAAIVCGAIAVAKEDNLGLVGVAIGAIGALLAYLVLTAWF